VSGGVRRTVFLLGAAGLGALLVWAATGMAAFGHFRGAYGLLLDRVTVAERHATSVVEAVTIDYRGVDTLGEEFILIAAVTGVALLLRQTRDEEEDMPRDDDEAPGHHAPETSDAVRVLALGMVGPTVLFGLYVVAHGHLTPGGGFQGGVVLASALATVYLAGQYLTFRRSSPSGLLDGAEGMGAGGYVAAGLVGLVTGGAFLQNVLPLGHPGNLDSAGVIPILNTSVGLEVAAAVSLTLSEFVEQTVLVRVGSGRRR
jgi:multicomponent Na+:H+ antiporter subunit B